MNEAHLQFLASPDWAKWLDAELLPWLVSLELGDDLIEVGPGPGRDFHVEDVFVPLPPDQLGMRLEAVGFRDVDVHVGDFELRFRATKPLR
jgi:hypothetical protein